MRRGGGGGLLSRVAIELKVQPLEPFLEVRVPCPGASRLDPGPEPWPDRAYRAADRVVDHPEGHHPAIDEVAELFVLPAQDPRRLLERAIARDQVCERPIRWCGEDAAHM